MEGYGDTGRIFNNAENDNQHKAKIAVDIKEYNRLSGKNAFGQRRSRIGPNRYYIEYEPKKIYIYIYIIFKLIYKISLIFKILILNLKKWDLNK